jgi:hypothetical protein
MKKSSKYIWLKRLQKSSKNIWLKRRQLKVCEKIREILFLDEPLHTVKYLLTKICINIAGKKIAAED